MTIRKPVLCLFFSFFLPLASKAAQPNYITYENRRMGTLEKPYLLRTHVPSLGLDDEVLSHHSHGFPSPRYSPFQRTFVHKRILWNDPRYSAAISVSYGPRLAYVWDTTECGYSTLGQTDSSIWRAIGVRPKAEAKWKLFSPSLRAGLLQGKGKPPLQINGKPHSGKINYYGNKRIEGHPEFSYQVDGRTITVSVRPGRRSDGRAKIPILKPADMLHYHDPKTSFEVVESKSGQLKVLLSPNAAETHHGFKKPNVQIAEASVEAGRTLYTTYGCIACHSLDGAKNHGPTFQDFLIQRVNSPISAW